MKDNHIQGIFLDQEISIEEEIKLINKLDDHHVCCNKKRTFCCDMNMNYGMLRVTSIEGLEQLIPSTLITVDDSKCCELNDNDGHNIHFKNIFTDEIECCEIEDIVSFEYTVNDDQSEQLANITKYIDNRKEVSIKLTGGVRSDIVYSTATDYMLKLCIALDVEMLYTSLTSLCSDVGIADLRSMWLKLISNKTDTAINTLIIEREEAVNDKDELTIEEIDVISGMLEELVKSTETTLSTFNDPTQIFSYWPALLLPAPQYVLSTDRYERNQAVS